MKESVFRYARYILLKRGKKKTQKAGVPNGATFRQQESRWLNFSFVLFSISHQSLAAAAQLLSHVWLFATRWAIAARLLCSWDFPGKNTVVGCYFLFQGIFLILGLNPCLLHWQADSLPLSHSGSPHPSLALHEKPNKQGFWLCGLMDARHLGEWSLRCRKEELK